MTALSLKMMLPLSNAPHAGRKNWFIFRSYSNFTEKNKPGDEHKKLAGPYLWCFDSTERRRKLNWDTSGGPTTVNSEQILSALIQFCCHVENMHVQFFRSQISRGPRAHDQGVYFQIGEM